jgi:hypothetical protein
VILILLRLGRKKLKSLASKLFKGITSLFVSSTFAVSFFAPVCAESAQEAADSSYCQEWASQDDICSFFPYGIQFDVKFPKSTEEFNAALSENLISAVLFYEEDSDLFGGDFETRVRSTYDSLNARLHDEPYVVVIDDGSCSGDGCETDFSMLAGKTITAIFVPVNKYPDLKSGFTSDKFPVVGYYVGGNLAWELVLHMENIEKITSLLAPGFSASKCE